MLWFGHLGIFDCVLSWPRPPPMSGHCSFPVKRAPSSRRRRRPRDGDGDDNTTTKVKGAWRDGRAGGPQEPGELGGEGRRRRRRPIAILAQLKPTMVALLWICGYRDGSLRAPGSIAEQREFLHLPAAEWLCRTLNRHGGPGFDKTVLSMLQSDHSYHIINSRASDSSLDVDVPECVVSFKTISTVISTGRRIIGKQIHNNSK